MELLAGKCILHVCFSLFPFTWNFTSLRLRPSFIQVSLQHLLFRCARLWMNQIYSLAERGECIWGIVELVQDNTEPQPKLTELTSNTLLQMVRISQFCRCWRSKWWVLFIWFEHRFLWRIIVKNRKWLTRREVDIRICFSIGRLLRLMTLELLGNNTK